MPLSTFKVKLILGFVWHNYRVLGEVEPGSVCEQGHEDKELGCKTGAKNQETHPTAHTNSSPRNYLVVSKYSTTCR